MRCSSHRLHSLVVCAKNGAPCDEGANAVCGPYGICRNGSGPIRAACDAMPKKEKNYLAGKLVSQKLTSVAVRRSRKRE